MTRAMLQILAVTGSLVCYVSAARSQVARAPELAPTGLFAAVLRYRLAVIEPTPINACSVHKLMDRPQDFPNGFPIAVQNVFDRRVSICAHVEKPMLDSLTPTTMRDLSKLPRDPGCVMIDSVRRVDSLATVYATAIRNGDAVHREEFKAAYQVSRREWVVTEARLHGLWYPHGRSGCP
jgi:hypothetical protein